MFNDKTFAGLWVGAIVVALASLTFGWMAILELLVAALLYWVLHLHNEAEMAWKKAGELDLQRINADERLGTHAPPRGP